MIKADHISNAKMFYNRFPDTTVIKIEIEESITVKTEINIAEAKQLRDDLTDLIRWITEDDEA